MRVRINSRADPALVPPAALTGTGVIVQHYRSDSPEANYPYEVAVDGIDPGTEGYARNLYTYAADELEWLL
jgi:hypothetical protein